MRREADGAHDPVPELLVQHRLVRIPVVLHDLVQPVDQRLLGRHLDGLAAVGEPRELRLEGGMVDVEGLGELLDVLGGGSGLAVEESGDGDFVAAELLGEGFEGELFAGFGGEEGRGGAGEDRVLGGLV